MVPASTWFITKRPSEAMVKTSLALFLQFKMAVDPPTRTVKWKWGVQKGGRMDVLQITYRRQGRPKA